MNQPEREEERDRKRDWNLLGLCRRRARCLAKEGKSDRTRKSHMFLTVCWRKKSVRILPSTSTPIAIMLLLLSDKDRIHRDERSRFFLLNNGCLSRQEECFFCFFIHEQGDEWNREWPVESIVAQEIKTISIQLKWSFFLSNSSIEAIGTRR
jgi:hypothetical protein